VLQLIPFIMVLLALLMMAKPVHAQAPTNTAVPTWTVTPTLHAPEPTSTSKYRGLRATPTPLFIPTMAANLRTMINANEAAGQIADNAINQYRYFNTNGVFDMVAFVF